MNVSYCFSSVAKLPNTIAIHKEADIFRNEESKFYDNNIKIMKFKVFYIEGRVFHCWLHKYLMSLDVSEYRKMK